MIFWNGEPPADTILWPTERFGLKYTEFVEIFLGDIVFWKVLNMNGMGGIEYRYPIVKNQNTTYSLLSLTYSESEDQYNAWVKYKRFRK